MYSTCLHCHGALGRNERFAGLPVGRRLAFDPGKGRLWVVCGRCGRWNLTPLEERWEVVEECERAFRDTRLRSSTDNVGLARLADGVDLVRIGTPLRPEMAAWRYGLTLLRRRRRALIPAIGVTVAAVGGNVLFTAGVIGLGTTVLGVGGGFALIAASMRRTWNPLVRLADGSARRLRGRESESVRLVPDGDSYAIHWDASGSPAMLHGTDADRALRSILAGANSRGGSATETAAAVSLLDAAGGPERFVQRLARASERHDAHGVMLLPTDLRLGLEMALHEESEKGSLAGEIAALENEWRTAEEIAGIADDLLLPAVIRARFTTRQDGDGNHVHGANSS